MIHKPVLLRETVNKLVSNRNGTYLDGTIGFAGHSGLILNKISNKGSLIGLDADPYAVKYSKKVLSTINREHSIHNVNFSQFTDVLSKLSIIKVDGMLLDLGLSSFQIDSKDRGFSYMKDTSLNMLFSNNGFTAKDLLNTSKVNEIESFLRKYGEIRESQVISESIINKVNKNNMKTTFDLVNSVADVISSKKLIKILSKVFQAIRIKVNDELNCLDKFLNESIRYLTQKGIICIITYHSLEDRIVKNFFRKKSIKCLCSKEILICTCKNKPTLKLLSKKPIRPSNIELLYNKRSRSAKLRFAEKT